MTQTQINTSLILNHTIFNLQTRPNPKYEKNVFALFLFHFFFKWGAWGLEQRQL